MRTRLEGSLRWLGPLVVQAAKTGVAAGRAWLLAADIIGNNLPVFAPLTAVLTVQVTVWDSVSRGLQRALGVVVGVLVAYALARLLGVHVWSLALVVFVSWLAGQVLRLGQQGAVQVPVSALLVLVLGASTSGYAVDRVFDTFLGAAVGILVSLVTVPKTNLVRAQQRVREVEAEIASVLRELADDLGGPAAGSTVPLDRARQLEGTVKSAALAVQSTVTATRWSPTGFRDRAAAEALVAAVESLDQVQRSTRGAARALADASPGLQSTPGLTRPLADLLRAAAGELDTWVLTAAEGSPESVGPTVTTVADKYREVLSTARSAGVPPELAATADAVAIYGLRISDDLRSGPAEAPAARPTWRSLLGH